MIEITHNYSSSSEWFNENAEQLIRLLEAKQINEKLLIMEGNAAEGTFYYSNVIPGLSALIVDMTFKEPLIVKRLKGEDDLYIIHLDFSDEMNLINVEGVKHEIGYKANLGLGIFDNAVENTFQPAIGERMYGVRLIVAKDLINNAIRNGNFKKSKKDKKTLFFYDHIDSESKIIMNDIKNRSVFDPGFEIYSRGIFLRLLANFVDRYSNLELMFHHTPDFEIQAVKVTKEYMLNNLFDEFPGIFLLAEMAGMSETKYKVLFKRIYVDTPNRFFIREKMHLAKELLKSGKFDSINDVSNGLKIKTINYFGIRYYKQFGRKISDDFITYAD